MANYINKHGETLWSCNNSMMDTIYEALKKVCEAKGIAGNNPTFEFIETLNQEYYGYGCIHVNIDPLLTHKKNLNLLIELYTEACSIILAEHSAWIPEAKNRLTSLLEILKHEYDLLQ